MPIGVGTVVAGALTSLQLPPGNNRAGVAFNTEGDRGEKDVVVDDLPKTFRRRSQMVVDSDSTSHLHNTARRPSADPASSSTSKAPVEKNKEEVKAAQDRRRSVRANTGHGHHHAAGAPAGAGKQAPKSAQSGTPSFGKTMDQSAKRINAAVHSLYRAVPRKVDEPVIDKKTPKKRLSSHDSKAAESRAAAEGGRRASVAAGAIDENGQQPANATEASSDSGSSDSSVGTKHDRDNQEHFEEDSGSDDYDFKAAASKVNTLLDSLNSETRTNIMSELNAWYTSRKAGVEDDLSELSNIDQEHWGREEETKNSMVSMLQSFEEKQMREVKVLVKCNRTLNLGARMKLKKRQRFAKRRPPQLETPSSAAASGTPKSFPATPVAPKGGSKPKSKIPKVSKKDSKKEVAKEVDDSSSTSKRRKSTAPDSVAEDGEDSQKADTEAAGSGNESEADEDSHEPGHAEDGEEEEELEYGEEYGSEGQDIISDMPIDLQDGLDVEAARRKLKEMHDVPQRVMAQINSDEPPAAEILQALATVQEGQMNLEIRAQLARKACDISKTALEHIAEGHPPDEADESVKELIEEVRVQVFGENGEGMAAGPDPEELEEECRALEALIAKQEKDIEEYKKARERSMRLEQDLADQSRDRDSDDGEDDTHAQPALLKSELRDGRLEAAQMTRRDAPPPKTGGIARGALQRVRNVIRTMKTRSSMEADGDAGGSATSIPTATANDGAPAFPSWQSNRQIQLLQEKISEKEGKIAKAREVYKKMKKEMALLRYCAKKSEAGLDALLDDFDANNIGDGSDSSCSSSDEGTGKKEKEKATGKGGGTSGQSDARQSPTGATPAGALVHAVPDASTSKGKDKHNTARATNKRASVKATLPHPENKSSPSPEPKNLHKNDPHRHKIDEKFQKEVQAFNSKKLEEAENEMKAKIEELQVQITRDVYKLKSEKKRQNLLKKDIKRLKKSYANMIKKHKGAPNTLEALDKQMSTLKEGESKLQTQIKELTEELNRQQRMLERAQAEAAEKEEIRAKMTASTSEPNTPAVGASPIPKPNMPATATGGGVGNVASSLAAAAASPAPGAAGTGTGASSFAATVSAATAAAAAAQGATAHGATTHGATANATTTATAAAPPAFDPLASIQRANATVAAKSGVPGGSGSVSEGAARGLRASEPEASKLSAPGNKSPAASLSEQGGAAKAANSDDTLSPRASALSTGSRSSALKHSGTGGTGASSPMGPKASGDQQFGKQSSMTKRESQEKPPPGGVGHEDLAELVRLQSRNEEYKQEIEDAMKKMQQLRLAMKKGKSVGLSTESIRDIVGATINQEDTKPPPEYFALKKEVRTKQNEVRGLRKRWWIDHKDLDALVDKVRHTHGPHEHPHGPTMGPRGTVTEHHGFHGHDGPADTSAIRRTLTNDLKAHQHDPHRDDHSPALSHHSGWEHRDDNRQVDGIYGHAAEMKRPSVKPRALGSLAAYRSVEAGVGTRYRLSSELHFGAHNQAPLSPPIGITGKTFTRQSMDVKSEDMSAVRSRFSQLRKSLVPEAAHSLAELVSEDHENHT